MRTNMKISKKINIGLKSNHTSMKTNKKLDFMSDEELQKLFQDAAPSSTKSISRTKQQSSYHTTSNKITSTPADKVKAMETLKKENEDLKELFDWIQECSIIKLNSLGKEKIPQSERYKHLTIGDLQRLIKLSQNIPKQNNNSMQKFINSVSFSDESISKIETPLFNIFKLENEVGPENTLSVISCYLFTTYGLYSLIKYEKFEKFIQSVTKGYNRANPYHTDLHAADIAQTCMIIMKYGKIKELLSFSDMDQCALFISCIVHDFKHPGVTNAFLINTADPIAIRYNDQSVLENFHIAQTFKLLKSDEQLNILSEFSLEDYKIMRKRIISCVLATDMVNHAKQFAYLKSSIEKYKISNGENVPKILENLDKMGLFSLQQQFMDIIIHACDISNPTKPLDVYEQWADKVMNEFWLQGDKEREMGIPISFLCDRYTITKAQGQVGFMEGVVTPFFSFFVKFFPGIDFLTDNLSKNKEAFKKIKEEEEKRKKGKVNA